MKLKMLTPWKESYDQPRQLIHYFANKGPSSQGYGFSSAHVWMWELDYKEGWEPKNWYFWTVVLEKTLESPLDCKEIQPVRPKGDQSWVFIGRTDVEAEIQYSGHLMWRADSFEKTMMLGKIESKRRRRQQGMRWLDGITNSMDLSLSTSGSWWWTETWGAVVHGVTKSVTRLCDWIALLLYTLLFFFLAQKPVSTDRHRKGNSFCHQFCWNSLCLNKLEFLFSFLWNSA